MTGDSITLPSRIRGKVRDQYHLPNQKAIALVTTDRQSGFDRSLASVPFKGAVLNLTSKWWFQMVRQRKRVCKETRKRGNEKDKERNDDHHKE